MKLRKAGVPLVKPVQLPLLAEVISLTESKFLVQCFFRPGRLQEVHGSKSTSAQCSQGLDPDVDEVATPTFCCQQHEKGLEVVLPSANVCCAPSVVIHVLPVKGTRGKESGVHDSRLCEQGGEYPRDQTVIKTFCLRLAIPTCWRRGESKKLGVFISTKKHKQHTNTKQHKKTPRQLRETLRFQKVPKPLSTAPRCHSKSNI